MCLAGPGAVLDGMPVDAKHVVSNSILVCLEISIQHSAWKSSIFGLGNGSEAVVIPAIPDVVLFLTHFGQIDIKPDKYCLGTE